MDWSVKISGDKAGSLPINGISLFQDSMHSTIQENLSGGVLSG
jgi:hypothetical protein